MQSKRTQGGEANPKLGLTKHLSIVCNSARVPVVRHFEVFGGDEKLLS
ncbi:MAG: hypothetical protein AAF738_01170 [Bacteroidota bacterium]